MRVALLVALLAAPAACASSDKFEPTSGGGLSLGPGADDGADSDEPEDSGESGPAGESSGPDDSGGGASSGSSGEASSSTGPVTTLPDWTASSTAPDPTTDSTTDPTDTGPACNGCDAPPGPCYEAAGECVDGECVYLPRPQGAPCDDDDACTSGESCDGGGACGGGALKDCARPNTTGGKCSAGACGGWKCVDPWEDCDNDMANGCEVPTGVANQCDQSGLTTAGCWTAYCGALNDPKAKNFGAFYCYACSTCNTPSPGKWQWCNQATGQWYTPADGACGSWEDKVCVPP